jgi:hypothetical protein
MLTSNWTPDLLRWRKEYEQHEEQESPLITKDEIMGRFAADSGGGSFQQLSAGTHLARCFQLVDIGTHHGEYQGQPTIRNQVIVRWEVPGETIEVDGVAKPMIASKFYTNSLGEKANLRKDLVAWRGREFSTEELMKFDLMAILGVPCMITVAHTPEGKAKVVGVSGLPKGIKCPPAVNPVSAFWIDEWNDELFQSLPDGFQKLVKESDEYKARNGAPQRQPKPEEDPLTDDIPF